MGRLLWAHQVVRHFAHLAPCNPRESGRQRRKHHPRPSVQTHRSRTSGSRCGRRAERESACGTSATLARAAQAGAMI